MFISQLALPSSREDLKRIESIAKGLQILINEGLFTAIVKQFSVILNRFLDESDQYDQGIRAQYEPVLREKEEKLSRQLGQKVTLDPFQDAEFVAFYNKNMQNLRQNYETVVVQVKEQADVFFKA